MTEKLLSRKMTARVAHMRDQANRLPLRHRTAEHVRIDRFVADLVPVGEGERRAEAREATRAEQQRELYRDTPPAPMTRQQLRAQHLHF